MDAIPKDTPGLLSRLFAGARARVDDTLQAAFESPEQTNARRAGMPTYSRRLPNPAWGDKRPRSGDRVVGRQVVSEGERPFGVVWTTNDGEIF